MLKLINVTKKFGEKIILNNFSYEFPTSGIVALIGESGVGKTTLLRLISELDRDYEGQIVNGGAKNVSYAFQEYRLFSHLNVLKNVTEVSFKKASDTEINKSRAMLLEFGFTENELNFLPNKLSGGMKQRVNLIRAFMKDAPILILDEPTKELDASLRHKVLDQIKSESENRLVIIVSHDPSDINYLSTKKIIL